MKSCFWNKVDIDSSYNLKIEDGQSLTYLPDKNKYLLFGEKYKKKDPRQKQQITNEKIYAKYIWLYDNENNIWTQQLCQGKLPLKRINHKSWIMENKFFIYGGISIENKILTDMYYLDTNNFTWKRFFFLEGPQARIHSQMNVCENVPYLIAGVTQPENLILNDVWKINFDDVNWNEITIEHSGAKWEQIEIQENNFPIIKGHSSIEQPKKQIMIFGGFDNKGIPKNKCYLLDLNFSEIKEHKTNGNKPCARAYHSMILVKKDLFCLFGGVSSDEESIKNNNANYLNDMFFYNIDGCYWSQLNIGGYFPSARYNFTLCSNQQDYNNQIVVLGGISLIQDSNMYILEEIDNNKNQGWQIQQKTEDQQIMKNNSAFNKISKANFEFNEAENITDEQKQMILVIERSLNNNKQKEQILTQEIESISKELNQINQINDKFLMNERTQLQTQQDIYNGKKRLYEQLQELVNVQTKKRKMYEKISRLLEDCFKKSENYIITVDQFFTQGLSQNIFNQKTIQDFQNAQEKKNHHRQMLIQFRKNYEMILNQEIIQKQKLKASKKPLKSVIDFKNLLLNSINQEEADFLNIKR